MDEVKDVLTFIVVLGLIIWGLFSLVNVLTRRSCIEGYSAYEPQYTFITGCRIMVDGKLTPTEIIREVQ